MKKLIAFFTFLFFSFTIFGQTLALTTQEEKTGYRKEIVSYQAQLKKTKNWEKYIEVVDLLLEKYKWNEEILKELKSKTEKVLNQNVEISTDINNMFYYLNAKLWLAIISLETTKSSAVLSPTITDFEKEKAKEKILELQKNLVEKWELMISTVVSEVEKSYNSKQTWDMTMNLDLNLEDLLNVSSKLELNNYTANTNWFDSQITGNLIAFFELVNADTTQENIKLNIESWMDVISKEWAIYFLFESMNIKEKMNLWEFETYLNKLSELAKSNQYIKVWNATSPELKMFNYKTFISDIKTSMTEPMLEAYQKEWDNYYLRPTKYACDSFKSFANKFDPFYWTSCSSSQYNSLLEDFSELWVLYMSLDDDKTTIGFEWITDYYISENKWFITFTNEKIIEYYYSIKPNQTNNPGEYFEISYANGKITWWMAVKWYSYDYESDDYLDNTYTFDLDWNVGVNNTLQNFIVNYSWVDEKGKQLTSWKFNLSWNNFSFVHNTNSYTNQIDVNINWTLDNEKILNDMNFSMTINERKYTYDYTNWTYNYDSTYTKVFDSKITINNKTINWVSNFYSDWNVAVKVSNTWNYTKNSIQLNNKIELSEEFSNLIFYWSDQTHKINWNFNINIDTWNSKNDVYMLFDVLDNNINIIKYELKNTWTTSNWSSSTIWEPSNSIDYTEAFGIEDYYYDDYYYYDY